MESLIRDWNGKTVIARHDRPAGAWIFIAIHAVRDGRAGGGTRFKLYPDAPAALRDAMRLAEGMSHKLAIAGLPFGGAKGVIFAPSDLSPEARHGLLGRYGALVTELGGLFNTGPDVGTSSDDMDVIAETGSLYIFGRTPAAGGSGSSGPATALGVFAGIQVACEHLFGESSVKGRRVLVQGAGSVGGELIRLLRDGGASVMFSDVDQETIRHFRDEQGADHVPLEEVYRTECDLLAPCALGGILNSRTIPLLRCKAVVGGANNQLAYPEDAQRLLAGGIFYAPDFVVNVGGVIHLVAAESLGWSHERISREVPAQVRRTLQEVIELAASRHITTAAAAQLIAEKRLAEARLH
jgi:leucine dehydrogenase